MAIPPALLKLIDMEVGSEVILTVENGSLIARPAVRRRYSMAELLKNSEAMKRLTTEVAWGLDDEPAGHEIV